MSGMTDGTGALKDPGPKPQLILPEGFYKAIPWELQKRPQWVCWRYQVRDGHWTKVPYDANFKPCGSKARPNDPVTWSPFRHAIECYINRKVRCPTNPVDGIGYMFSSNDPYTGVDFDNCLGPDGLADWAKSYIGLLMPTYGEVSPSGRGIKFIVRGSLNDTGTRKSGFGDGTGGVEMYDQLRFFTITGNVYEPGVSTDIAERADNVLRIYKEIKAKGKKNKDRVREPGQQGTGALDLSDSELVNKAIASAQGTKFQALYSAGDISDYQNDHSCADLALCSMLAFWCGPDAARIERIFNTSALGQREKWTDRPDYRDSTIGLALEDADVFYSPTFKPKNSKPRGGKPKFGVFNGPAAEGPARGVIRGIGDLYGRRSRADQLHAPRGRGAGQRGRPQAQGRQAAGD